MKIGVVMSLPLMPKATAIWLIENTMLSFKQIAHFTELHELEIQALADGDIGIGIIGVDPIASGQLRQDEIQRCEKSPNTFLKPAENDLPPARVQTKGARYTSISKRQERPNAIAWLLKYHPELSEIQISKLIGTTKEMITKIRERQHCKTSKMTLRNPVTIGLCLEIDLEKQVMIARAKHPEKIIQDIDLRSLHDELQSSHTEKKVHIPKKHKDNKLSDYIKEAEKMFHS